MRNYRILKEEQDHMLLQVDGETSPLKVAINNRHHSTVQKIRKYAKGGQVPEDDPTSPFRDSEDFVAPLKNAVSSAAHAILPLGDEPVTPPVSEAAQGVPDMLARPAPDAPVSAPAQAPQAPQGMALPSASPITSQANAAGTAMGKEAQAQQAGFTDIAGKQAEAASHIEQSVADSQKMLMERNTHQEQLFNDVMSEKIDPNHFWNSRSTGQKVAAGIGLILGGIGAGLTKGPNYAVELLNKNIDRDMDAQRLNLGKQQNLLTHYMQQTRDIQLAQHLTRADYLTAVAAQVASAQAKMGAAMSVPHAQAAVAELRMRAAAEGQAYVARALQIKESQINLGLSQQHAQALGELLKGVSGGGGFDARLLELPGMEKYRERSVTLPDGSVGFASDKEEANKANESMATVSRLKSKLQRYSSLLEGGSPTTLDRGTAREQYADLLSEIGHLHDLNRLSDKDLELFKEQVPDIAGLTTLKGFSRQKLKGVGDSLDDKVWSINKTILRRSGRRPGG